MIPKALISCTNYSLKILKRTLEEHSGRIPGKTSLRQILGEDMVEIMPWLKQQKAIHGSVIGALDVIDAIMQTRALSQKPEDLFDLIVSGPEVAEVPTCETLTTIHDLIHLAKKEILICDYAIYGAESIFDQLRVALTSNPSLRVRLILHVFEDNGGRHGRLKRFADDFLANHWKASVIPELYVDPQNLSTDSSSRTSMHAKCFIADRAQALITSANLTDAAHHKNIEAGIVVRYSPMVDRLTNYFDGLIEGGHLIQL